MGRKRQRDPQLKGPFINKDGQRYLLVKVNAEVVRQLKREVELLRKAGMDMDRYTLADVLLASWKLYHQLSSRADIDIQSLNDGWDLWVELLQD